MWICSKGLIDRCSFLVADIFLLESLRVLFLLFLPMALWLSRAALPHHDSSVYLLQLEGLDCVLSFSLISNWLMLLAWWGLQWWGFKHQAAVCIMGGNFSRCIHFVPLSSSPDFLLSFFCDSCRGEHLYGSMLGH
jgi:hypothetical protein